MRLGVFFPENPRILVNAKELTVILNWMLLCSSRPQQLLLTPWPFSDPIWPSDYSSTPWMIHLTPWGWYRPPWETLVYADMLVKVVANLGLIKPCSWNCIRTLLFLILCNSPILTYLVKVAFGPKLGFKNKCRAWARFGLQNEAHLQLWKAVSILPHEACVFGYCSRL